VGLPYRPVIPRNIRLSGDHAAIVAFGAPRVADLEGLCCDGMASMNGRLERS